MRHCLGYESKHGLGNEVEHCPGNELKHCLGIELTIRVIFLFLDDVLSPLPLVAPFAPVRDGLFFERLALLERDEGDVLTTLRRSLSVVYRGRRLLPISACLVEVDEDGLFFLADCLSKLSKSFII